MRDRSAIIAGMIPIPDERKLRSTYGIVKSPYAGFDVVAIDPELYADALADELIDGLPTLPRLGKGILRGL